MPKRVLVVTPWIPYPITGADQQDRFQGFLQLQKAGYDIHVLAKIHAFQDEGAIQTFYADAGIALTLVPYTSSRASLLFSRLGRIAREPALLDGAALEYTDPRMEEAVRNAVQTFQPDTAWVEFSFLWPVVRLLKSLGVPSVMRSANNEAQQSIDEHGGSMMARLMAIPRFRGEHLVAWESAHVCAITPWEETWYRQCNATHVSVLPLRGLARTLRRRTHVEKDILDVVFLGSSYTNGHNRDALKFLLTRIVPAVAGAKEGGHFRFHITGKKFPDAFRTYLTPEVTVHDFIPDIDAFLDTMDIAVCPSVSGQGMQQKIFEPLCCGLPLVTHHTAGYPFEDGVHVLIASDAEDYVRQILSLGSASRRQQLADAAYVLSSELFSEGEMMRIASEAIEEAGGVVSEVGETPQRGVFTGNGRLRRFGRYLFSGLFATGVDIGLFLLFTFIGIYFLTASILSGTIAFVTVFYLHKHVTYKTTGQSKEEFVRFCVITLLNFLAQNVILYIAVTAVGIPEGISKVIANGSSVLWNFFLYRKFVYRHKT